VHSSFLSLENQPPKKISLQGVCRVGSLDRWELVTGMSLVSPQRGRDFKISRSGAPSDHNMNTNVTNQWNMAQKNMVSQNRKLYHRFPQKCHGNGHPTVSPFFRLDSWIHFVSETAMAASFGTAWTARERRPRALDPMGISGAKWWSIASGNFLANFKPWP